MTATLCGSLTGEVIIEDQMLVVADECGGDAGRTTEGTPGAWIRPGENILLLFSGTSELLHCPGVRLEAWDSAPPPQTPGEWSDEAETTVRLESGVVDVQSLTGGESAGPPLQVGPPGTYAVRAYRTGADGVDAEVARDSEAEPRGVERFLLQLWPHTPEEQR